MFAIPFLSKLLRYVPIAVVLAAFIWGFGHAGYPQQPFWIRGVEVGIGGVALGLIMLRWGILPTLVWHYSVDAMYTALLLLRSHHPYFVFSGAASAGIMVLPVLVAGIAYLRRGGFEPRTGSRPPLSSCPRFLVPSPRPPVAESLPYTPWPARRRLTALCSRSSGPRSVSPPCTCDEFGGEPRFALGPTRARAAAEQFARTQGFDPRGYRSVAFPVTKWDDADTRLTAKYFVERRDIAYVRQRISTAKLPCTVGLCATSSRSQREEMRVSVDPENGRVFEFEHILPEDQPGADLSADAARELVSRAPGLPPLDGIRCSRNPASKRRRRAAIYTLVWEARAGRSAQSGRSPFPRARRQWLAIGSPRSARSGSCPRRSNARASPAQCAFVRRCWCCASS